MGAYTHFYGKLRFATMLSAEELEWLERVMAAPGHYSARASSEYWEIFQREMRKWDNELDNARMREYCDKLMAADGFVRMTGMSYAADMRMSDEKDGLVYAGEKSYDFISGINFIIANARNRIPDFGLKGSLYANTEFEPYDWLVKINDEGWAYQEKCDRHALWDHDKKAYLEWLQLELRSRREAPPTKTRGVVSGKGRRLSAMALRAFSIDAAGNGAARSLGSKRGFSGRAFKLYASR